MIPGGPRGDTKSTGVSGFPKVSTVFSKRRSSIVVSICEIRPGFVSLFVRCVAGFGGRVGRRFVSGMGDGCVWRPARFLKPLLQDLRTYGQVRAFAKRGMTLA